MFKLTLRSLLDHKVRFFLTGFAVVLGVAFVVVSFVLSDTLRSTFDSVAADIAESINVQVRGRETIEGDALSQLAVPLAAVDALCPNDECVEGVEVANPGLGGPISGLTHIPADGERAEISSNAGPILMFGGDPDKSDAASSFDLLRGDWPRGDLEAAIDIDTFDDDGFALGDSIEVRFIGEPLELVVTGVVRFGTDNGAGPKFVLTDLGPAQALYGFAADEVSGIDVKGSEGVSDEALADIVSDTLASELGPDAAADLDVLTQQQVEDDFADQFGTIVDIFRTVLLVFAGIALFVSIFLIFNTFNIVIGQRIRELALLRAIGATSRQIIGMVLGEALVIAIAASFIGLVLGVVIAAGFQAALEATVNFPSASLVIKSATWLVAVVVGVGVTMGSALKPAFQAGSVPPVAAMQSEAARRNPRASRITLGIGAILAALGLGLLLVSVFGEQSSGVQTGILLGVGGVLTFIGAALLSPTIARPVANTIGRVPVAVALAAVGGLTVAYGVWLAISGAISAVDDAEAFRIPLGIIGAGMMAGAAWGLNSPLAVLRRSDGPSHDLGIRFVRILFIVGMSIVLLIGFVLTTLLSSSFAIVVFVGATLLLGGIAGFGIPGRLARRTAATNNARTALTAAALMIGLALVGMASTVGESLRVSVSDTLENAIVADYFVATDTFQGFSPTLRADLAELDEVGEAASYRQGVITVADDTKRVWATQGEILSDLIDLDLESGSYEGLADYGILVHEDPAEEANLRAGDPLCVLLPEPSADALSLQGDCGEGETTFTVIGIHTDASILENWVIDLIVFEENLPPSYQADLFVAATIADGVDPEAARAAVDGVAEAFPEIELQDRDEFAAAQEEQLDQFLFIINGFLALSIIIAVLGIANTMALAVFERTRELGLLRAVGMTSAQMKGMVRWEAVIVALFGAVLGLVIGVVLGWAAVAALPDSIIQTFAVPVRQLVAVLLFAAAVGVIAAYFPARRAGRLDILDAISHV